MARSAFRRRSASPIDPAAIDIVIVPGLAFTRDGRRLGQGGGFYDRFLAQLPADCTTIGVGFAEQLLDDLPVEPHDRILSRGHHRRPVRVGQSRMSPTPGDTSSVVGAG